jgi:hypothetical protein
MSRLFKWPSRRKTMENHKPNEDITRKLEEAKGELQTAVADYHMKMDWARTLARQTLNKAEGRR